MSATKEHYHKEIEAGMKSTTPATGSKNSGNTSFPSLQWGECESQCDGMGGSASTRQPKASSRHKIQWLNLPGYKGETWNPIIGCSKVSDGCKNCYAEKMAMRLQHMYPASLYYDVLLFEPLHQQKGWSGKTRFVPSQIDKPMRWKSPRVVFVCSMGDLFHESTSFDAIEAVFSVMADCDRHIYIVLTKRPERMLEFYNWKSSFGIPWVPSDNIWMGVTAENQEQLQLRITPLVEIPAAIKFISIEPMLSEISFRWLYLGNKWYQRKIDRDQQCGEMDAFKEINWVICGGESGHHARPVHPDWVRSLRNQCEAAGVPFFFKQWGEWIPVTQMPTGWGHPADVKGKHSWVNRADGKNTGEGPGEMTIKVGKHKSGNTLDGVKYEQYPKFTPTLKGEKKPAESSSAPFRAGGENQHPESSNK